MSFSTPDPINPQQTDASSGSLFTGAERETRVQGLPLLELLAGFGLVVLLIAAIVAATWIL